VRRVALRADADDVVAEVFAVAWRRLDDVPPAPADLLWLYAVARRVIASQHRRMRRLASLIARVAMRSEGGVDRRRGGHGGVSHGNPEFNGAVCVLPSADALAERVRLAIADLRSGEREALRLVYWEQLSHAEAGKVLGCSANAVAIRVHRAKARLRTALGDNVSTAAKSDPPAVNSGAIVSHPDS
jgi:RNA polymerase sigma factor (sigma-70 family)